MVAGMLRLTPSGDTVPRAPATFACPAVEPILHPVHPPKNRPWVGTCAAEHVDPDVFACFRTPI